MIAGTTMMEIGASFTFSYEYSYIATTEKTFNGISYVVYYFDNYRTLFVKKGVEFQNPLNIKGHVITTENEIKDGDYYFMIDAKYAIPL